MIDPHHLIPEQIELLNTLPTAVIFLDINGQCIFANNNWTQISGKNQESSRGEGWQGAIISLDQPTLKQNVARTIHDQLDSSLNLRIGNLQSQRWFHATFQPIKSGDNNLIGILGTFVNINTVVSRMEELDRQNKDLDNLNRLLIDRELTMIELKKEIARLRGANAS